MGPTRHAWVRQTSVGPGHGACVPHDGVQQDEVLHLPCYRSCNYSPISGWHSTAKQQPFCTLCLHYSHSAPGLCGRWDLTEPGAVGAMVISSQWVACRGCAVKTGVQWASWSEHAGKGTQACCSARQGLELVRSGSRAWSGGLASPAWIQDNACFAGTAVPPS